MLTSQDLHSALKSPYRINDNYFKYYSRERQLPENTFLMCQADE